MPSAHQRTARAPVPLRVLLSPRLPAVLLVLMLAWFALWAVDPWFPADFVVEHVLTVLVVVFLVWARRHRLFSNLSHVLLFCFVALHVVGAHYTYEKVPYEQWFGTVAGWLGVEGFSIQSTLGFQRNHYDRLVHLAFGLLCAYPIRELFVRLVRVRGVWGYLLPLDVTLSLSALYELLEWAVAMILAADVGQSYLGTQGDEWDAHKDMALATAGACIAMLVTALVNWRLQRDFAQELAESMRVDTKTPMGEERIVALVDDRARDRD